MVKYLLCNLARVAKRHQSEAQKAINALEEDLHAVRTMVWSLHNKGVVKDNLYDSLRQKIRIIQEKIEEKKGLTNPLP